MLIRPLLEPRRCIEELFIKFLDAESGDFYRKVDEEEDSSSPIHRPIEVTPDPLVIKVV